MTKLNDKLSISICPFVFHYTCLGWMMTEDIQLPTYCFDDHVIFKMRCSVYQHFQYWFERHNLNLNMFMCVKMNEDK